MGEGAHPGIVSERAGTSPQFRRDTLRNSTHPAGTSGCTVEFTSLTLRGFKLSAPPWELTSTPSGEARRKPRRPPNSPIRVRIHFCWRAHRLPAGSISRPAVCHQVPLPRSLRECHLPCPYRRRSLARAAPPDFEARRRARAAGLRADG